MTVESTLVTVFAAFMCAMGLWSAYAQYRQRTQGTRLARGLYWDVVYKEANGDVLMSTIHVLGLDATARCLTAWCCASGCQRPFAIQNIMRAKDLHTGRRVKLSGLPRMHMVF